MRKVKTILKFLRNKMEFKKFIKYALKAKRFTTKGIKEVSEMPLEKIVIGTTAMVLPGGIVISGVYVAAQELKQRYELYEKENQEKGEDVKSFTSWLNENYADYLKEKKDVVVDNVSDKVSDTVDYVGKGVSTVGTSLKRVTVGAVSSILKRRKP